MPKAHLQNAGYWHVFFSNVDATSGNISLQDSMIELKDNKNIRHQLQAKFWREKEKQTLCEELPPVDLQKPEFTQVKIQTKNPNQFSTFGGNTKRNRKCI